jgi:hypothetical protein
MVIYRGGNTHPIVRKPLTVMRQNDKGNKLMRDDA